MATKKKTTAPKKKEEQPFVSTLGNIDSKFRFVHLASKRAKTLLKGAKTKTRAKTRNPIILAQHEVKEGLIDFRVLPFSPEEILEKEDRSFLGGDGVGAAEVELEADVEDEAEVGAEEGAAADEEKEEEEYEAELPDGFEDAEKEEG
ncbi:MAG: DNA-directed RNA polymerase subunit omega [Candidatus Aminicenantes bacterium]|nr:DNA-directed RNA polymerase subunit omega [Candidatus Aminicenantes bacterium]